MTISGPIIFVEDDLDDQEVFTEALRELGITDNYKFFGDGKEALEYLQTTTEQPFVIFCDVNMPRLNGIELRNEINNSNYLKQKSIPFVFFTTALNKKLVDEAFSLSVQGFFKKPEEFSQIMHIIKQVLDYWYNSKHPNSIRFS
ncbi:response regulator [Segetibacter koreensis]|uniref:response regulator n=1 Tax=Segetibacter koreensis TaxID=398037 RepID=UPI0003828602|nr:response regulator [Segetibacter koreensis]